jgi:hypothetical protein
MNKKSMTIALIALGVLIILFYVQKHLTTSTTDLESISELSVEFDSDAVAKIDVFKRDFPDSGLHFAKTENNNWVLVNAFNAPLKEDDVNLLITDLSNVTGSIRGDSEELYPDFKITDESALQIEFYDNADSKLVHIYVGKGGESGKQCFIRLAGSPEVYLADANFISRFAAWEAPPEKKLPTDRWMDLNLSGLDREAINAFTINAGTKRYEFALVPDEQQDTLLLETKKSWKLVYPEKGIEVADAQMNTLFSRMVSMRAINTADPKFKDQFGLDKPTHTIQIFDTAGNVRNIAFSKPYNDDGERYVTSDRVEGVFVFNKYSFESLFVTPFEQKK